MCLHRRERPFPAVPLIVTVSLFKRESPDGERPRVLGVDHRSGSVVLDGG